MSGRLTSLIEPWGRVEATDQWMPDGFTDVTEARLDTADRLIPDKGVRDDLLNWWLAVPAYANTPNWDIASTCTIGGRKGLLLVEAKAHDMELIMAMAGKSTEADGDNSHRNHSQIGNCIKDASMALSSATGASWTLSRDRNYQMSNRFAWCWKLTELGISVILVYLGFLRAEEMRTSGTKPQTPLANSDHWAALVKDHSSSLFPIEIWNKELKLGGQSFIPLIRTAHQPLTTDLDTEIV
ncbi:MAG: hypothetical protein Q7T82_17605 [Armatimonadota bacterium]|nr:hypothetical protein [Armatimonadota bacterium]